MFSVIIIQGIKMFFYIYFRVHIRRTDKIKETSYVNITRYMEAVDEWYNLHDKCSVKAPRNIFLASDDPDVVRYIRERYYLYVCIINKKIALH